jgi:imidazolonepropionase-like amidohydrolase
VSAWRSLLLLTLAATFAATITACAAATPTKAQAPATAPGPNTLIAIVNADLHTMAAAGRLQGATVLIRDGKIAAIGADVVVPAGAEVIDAAGGPVTPGLISSATQLGLVEVSSSADTVDRSGSGGRLGAAFDISRGLNFNSTLIPIARADGLTHGIVVPSDSAVAPFAGSGAVINVGTGSDLLERRAIGLFAAVSGETTSGSGQSRSAEWIVLRQALAAARDLPPAGGGATALSLQDYLDRADLEALRPVLTGTVPLVLRVKRESDIRQAVALGEDFGIRVILYEATEAWRAGDLLAQHRVPVILDPTDNLPRRFDEIGARLDNAALLHRAGVPLGFFVGGINMSHNVGIELRQSAGIAVANGLPRDAALAAITSGAARIWGIDDHAGALAPGRTADLVIWSGDPLEVTSAPVAVLVDGRRVPLETRQTELRNRYHPHPRTPTSF